MTTERGQRLGLQCRGHSRFESQKFLAETRLKQAEEPSKRRLASIEVQPKEVILEFEGTTSEDNCRLKLTLPPSWDGKPASKLAATLAKTLNGKDPARALTVRRRAARHTLDPRERARVRVRVRMRGPSSGEQLCNGVERSRVSRRDGANRAAPLSPF